MTKTADAVVIGAGVNGASTAYNLVKRGLKKVVLVEKHLIASGGTGRSAAIVRQHYSNEALAKMVKRSGEVFRNFDEEIGGDPGFVNTGWAFLIPESVSEGFSQNLAMHQKLGIDTGEISKEELKEIEPRINLSDVHRIAYEPGSGYADPHAVTYCYVQRFLEMGGELMQMTPAQDVMAKKRKAPRRYNQQRGDIHRNGRQCCGTLGRQGREMGRFGYPDRGDSRGGDHSRNSTRGRSSKIRLLRYGTGHLLPPRGSNTRIIGQRISQRV